MLVHDYTGQFITKKLVFKTWIAYIFKGHNWTNFVLNKTIMMGITELQKLDTVGYMNLYGICLINPYI